MGRFCGVLLTLPVCHCIIETCGRVGSGRQQDSQGSVSQLEDRMMKTVSVLTAVCLVLMATGTAISVPYSVDSHTLHLYHFDGDAPDSVTDNPIHLVLDSRATAN